MKKKSHLPRLHQGQTVRWPPLHQPDPVDQNQPWFISLETWNVDRYLSKIKSWVGLHVIEYQRDWADTRGHFKVGLTQSGDASLVLVSVSGQRFAVALEVIFKKNLPSARLNRNWRRKKTGLPEDPPPWGSVCSVSLTKCDSRGVSIETTRRRWFWCCTFAPSRADRMEFNCDAGF